MGQKLLMGRIKSVKRIIYSSLASLVIVFVMIFWPAGMLNWAAGWLYLGLFVVSSLASYFYLLRINPDVIEYRLHTGPGTKTWDKVFFVFFIPLTVSIFVVAGFDAVRFDWSDMSLYFWPLGLLLWVTGYSFIVWAMGVNPFFEKTVRLQAERGHYVIQSGPYQFIRHPGYTGFVVWFLATPFLLGSWYAFLPTLILFIILLIRTYFEDKMLQEELEGYSDYVKKTPYRLMPGVW
jgi:protein-S-isoprenylcysteine O-methyltransferase Ste14